MNRKMRRRRIDRHDESDKKDHDYLVRLKRKIE